MAPTETHEPPPPSAGQIDVEPAIAQIRAGRPVILEDAESQIVVFGVERLAAALTGAWRGYNTYDADTVLGFDHDQRRFDFAADMLQKLGAARVRIMTNNPVKIAALENAGIDVVSDQRVIGRKTVHNLRYLAGKRDRSGHLLEQDL